MRNYLLATCSTSTRTTSRTRACTPCCAPPDFAPPWPRSGSVPGPPRRRRRNCWATGRARACSPCRGRHTTPMDERSSSAITCTGRRCTPSSSPCPHASDARLRRLQMRRQYRVVDIAAQAGLSHATVDRVLHSRPGVRPETVAQVQRAIGELDRQRSQVELSSKTIILGPGHAGTGPVRDPECRNALEVELRALRPAVLRVRSSLRETSDPDAAAHTLDAIVRRGSDGVILKAPDHSDGRGGRGAVRRGRDPGGDVRTDVPSSRRTAYVGETSRQGRRLLIWWRIGRGLAATCCSPSATHRFGGRRSASAASGRSWRRWRRHEVSAP